MRDYQRVVILGRGEVGLILEALEGLQVDEQFSVFKDALEAEFRMLKEDLRKAEL